MDGPEERREGMNLAEFSAQIDRLRALYDWQPTTVIVDEWWRALNRESAESLRLAVDALADEWRPTRNQRFPLIPDVRERIPRAQPPLAQAAPDTRTPADVERNKRLAGYAVAVVTGRMTLAEANAAFEREGVACA
jgi:hypothetical protein